MTWREAGSLGSFERFRLVLDTLPERAPGYRLVGARAALSLEYPWEEAGRLFAEGLSHEARGWTHAGLVAGYFERRSAEKWLALSEGALDSVLFQELDGLFEHYDAGDAAPDVFLSALLLSEIDVPDGHYAAFSSMLQLAPDDDWIAWTERWRDSDLTAPEARDAIVLGSVVDGWIAWTEHRRRALSDTPGSRGIAGPSDSGISTLPYGWEEFRNSLTLHLTGWRLGLPEPDSRTVERMDELRDVVARNLVTVLRTVAYRPVQDIADREALEPEAVIARAVKADQGFDEYQYWGFDSDESMGQALHAWRREALEQQKRDIASEGYGLSRLSDVVGAIDPLEEPAGSDLEDEGEPRTS